MEDRPTILHFSGLFGLSPDHLMEVVCIVGASLSMLATLLPSFASKSTFIIVWILYLSLYQVKNNSMTLNGWIELPLLMRRSCELSNSCLAKKNQAATGIELMTSRS